MGLNTYEEKIIYLANIIAIARADGSISPLEVEAIEKAQKNIKARKTELKKAYKMAESNDFEINPLGHWSDKVNNLEDMIFVSAVDGLIDNKEKPSILKFAKQIKINQEQIRFILDDVTQEISSTSNEISCPKCKKIIKQASKFCSECGAVIKEEISKQAVQITNEIPKTGITIEFAESTAAAFTHAVQEQKKAPVNSTCLKNNKTWYMASWPKESIVKILPLVEHIKGMRNRRVFVEGNETQWNDVFSFSWCVIERNTAYRPDEYCFGLSDKRLNIWGCIQSQMDWTEWSDWFSYGQFRTTSGLRGKRTIFIFDKKRIRHELETSLFNCKFCPYLQFDLIEAVLDEFPNRVTITNKSNWTYKQDYTESPDSIKVTMKITENGCTYVKEFYSSGVVPKSVSIGVNILKKAFEACHYDTEKVKGLLEFKE